MRPSALRLLLLLLPAVVLAALPSSARQPSKPGAPPEKLPPLSYVCPMTGDEDVIEDKPGKCRRCGMGLQAVRLVSVWTCPGQPGMVTQEQPGRCPVDGRPLVQMTMALTWACPGVNAESTSPGSCADGTARRPRYALRPHGNHNPQHGGQFFMAPDNWHHLEGAYFAPGTFRLYLYDDFTRPLPLALLQAASARAILTKDGREFPLTRNGRFLEVTIGKLPFPVTMQAKLKFKKDAPEHRFDFAFEGYSHDAPLPAPTLTNAAPEVPVPPSVPATAMPPPNVTPPGGDPALVTVPIPETVPEMLAELRVRNDQIRMLIDRGQFASVYVPAFQAKDVALALDAHRHELPAGVQKVVEPAVARLVRNAYLLDAFGDLGNKQQIAEAYARFASALKDIESAISMVPPEPTPRGARR